MRFVVDEQLPPALADWLTARGCLAQHVRGMGLARGKDREVWASASETGAIVITKDEDFVEMSRFKKEKVPIVWLRIGNCTNPVLLNWLAPLWPSIEAKLQAGEILIEVVR